MLLLSPAVVAGTVNWQSLRERIAPGIVRVHVVYEKPDWGKPFLHGELKRRRGTGFFVNGSQIVTNHHIVEGAREIKLEGVATKEKFAVRLAARPSEVFDLALLEFADEGERERFIRINGPIVPLEAADRAGARPGAEVAVLGFGNSEQLVATQGIVSSWEPHHDLYQRRLDGVTLIRTDAAVNPGNSGGPCVAPDGRVVGIGARYGEGENIGLLVPYVTAEKVIRAMQAEGKFTKTALGLVTYSLNPVLRRTLNLAVDQDGVVVSHVFARSPAQAAGIGQWDVLTEVNGYPIRHGEIRVPQIGKVPFRFLFNAEPPGTRVTFGLLRGRKAERVPVTLAPFDVPRLWLPTEPDGYKPEWGYLGGLVIVEVTRGLLDKVEQGGNWRWDLVNDQVPGGKLYLVTDVEPGTQAMSYQDYGLDLFQLRILAIDGAPLERDLGPRLRRLYRSIAAGRAPPVITVHLEKNLTIQLESDRLGAEWTEFIDRYTELR